MNNENNLYDNGISFSDMWHNFIDHIVTVAIIIVVCVGSFLTISVMKGKTYSSSATLNVTSGSVDNSINVKKSIMEVLINDELLTSVSKELNIDKATIKDSFSLSTDDKSTKIIVTYTSKNNEKCVELANSFAKNAINFLNKTNDDGSYVHDKFYGTTKVFSEASNVNVHSSTKKYFVFGTLFGLMIGGMFVLVITINDNHFKNRKEVECLRLPLLGEVSSYKEENKNVQ